MLGRATSLRALAALATGMLAALGLSLVPSPAHALAPPTPWDGTNPFHCVVQDAGLGPTGPDPGADPYCVRFDKTHQNVTQLGIVDFLLKEPARTAAAVSKCFYFQEDHWRGSIVQDGTPAVYEFEGHYFFNKATGDGGVWVTGFTVDGQTFDPTALPGFPPGYGGYFGPGTGGLITHNAVPTDPRCVALAQHSPTPVYPPSSGPRCVPDAGSIDRSGLGPLRLGAREDAVRAELGPPGQVKRGFLRYCVIGGGSLLVGQPGDRSGSFGVGGRAPTVMLMTTAPGFALHGRRHRLLGVGGSIRALRRAFPSIRMIALPGGLRVLRAAPGVLVGQRHGRIVYLAVYDPRAIGNRRSLGSYLRRAR
jgi:hypothetical protein